MYKAALFDLDGTLTDSMNLSAQAFIHTLRIHLGKEFTPEGIFAMFGPGEEEIFHRLDPAQAKEMMETFLDFYQSNHQRFADIYPGVRQVLDWLKGRIPMAVITGKGKEPALITLAQLGLSDYFDLVVTGSCVKEHKPHPEGIGQILSCFNVLPQQAFYLGDSPGDMETARRAGVAALAALWGARDPEFLIRQEHHRAFANPQEFLAWLEAEVGDKKAEA